MDSSSISSSSGFSSGGDGFGQLQNYHQQLEYWGSIANYAVSHPSNSRQVWRHLCNEVRGIKDFRAPITNMDQYVEMATRIETLIRENGSSFTREDISHLKELNKLFLKIPLDFSFDVNRRLQTTSELFSTTIKNFRGETPGNLPPPSLLSSPASSTAISYPPEISKALATIEAAAEEAEKTGAPKEELALIKHRAKAKLEKGGRDSAEFVRTTIETIRQFKETAVLANRVGYKAANLVRIDEFCKARREDRVEVPFFHAISHQPILAILERHSPDFTKNWRKFVAHWESTRDLQSAKPILDMIQDDIRTVFRTQEIITDKDLTPFIDAGRPMMVRSTGREDTLKVANPGGNLSVANVKPEKGEITQAAGEVVASYFSLSSLGQRLASGDIITMPPLMPILLQIMVGESRESSTADASGDSAKIPISGVMFSTEGNLDTPNVVQISATFGHAEGVVTGKLPNDQFYVQRGRHVRQIVHDKHSRRAPDVSGGLTSAPNPREIRSHPCLTKTQLIRLAKIGSDLEREYGFPVDVEWSYDPKTDTFFIFQVRPIPLKPAREFSYVHPAMVYKLENNQQIEVIGAGKGNVLRPNKANVLFADSAPAAKEEYLKMPPPPPEAIILANSTAPNSHEASFFASLQIPVIHIAEPAYAIFTSQLDAGKQLLIDTQEAFFGTVPEGMEETSFITPGLRRHLAPKTESSEETDLALFNPFLKALVEAARGFCFEVSREEEGGRNLIDIKLNIIESARTPGERAYLLTQLLKSVNKTLLKNVPLEQRKSVQYKILSAAEQVWDVFNDPATNELERMFAMNWLRAVLLRRPQHGAVHAPTVFTELGAAQERRDLGISVNRILMEKVEGISAEEIETASLRDLLLRCAKFIINPFDREKWIALVERLPSPRQQELSSMIGLLGPAVTEVWLNSSFTRAAASSRNLEDLFTTLQVELSKKRVMQTITLANQARSIAAQFKQKAAEFADPARFNSLLPNLEKDLLNQGLIVVNHMRKAQGVEAVVLAQAFREIVSAYDDCIKALTGSPLYTKDALQASRFARLLNGYHAMAIRAVDPRMFAYGKALFDQATTLQPYLRNRFTELKRDSSRNPTQSLHSSPTFSVSRAALGSGCQIPARAAPDSLEDYFTLIHQSMVTTAATVETRGGIKTSTFPPEVATIVDHLTRLNLFRPDDDVPDIQSIEYSYPSFKIFLNLPLQNHSAQLCLEGRLAKNGSLDHIELESRFLCGGGTSRGASMTYLALQSYLPTPSTPALMAPKGYKLQLFPDGETCIFRWALPLPLDGKYLSTCQKNLQAMIRWIQLPSSRFPPMELDTLAAALNLFPWLAQSLFKYPLLEGTLRTEAARNLVIEHLFSRPSAYTTNNITPFLENFDLIPGVISADNIPFMTEFVQKILDQKELWSLSSYEFRSRFNGLRENITREKLERFLEYTRSLTTSEASLGDLMSSKKMTVTAAEMMSFIQKVLLYFPDNVKLLEKFLQKMLPLEDPFWSIQLHSLPPNIDKNLFNLFIQKILDQDRLWQPLSPREVESKFKMEQNFAREYLTLLKKEVRKQFLRDYFSSDRPYKTKDAIAVIQNLSLGPSGPDIEDEGQMLLRAFIRKVLADEAFWSNTAFESLFCESRETVRNQLELLLKEGHGSLTGVGLLRDSL